MKDSPPCAKLVREALEKHRKGELLGDKDKRGKALNVLRSKVKFEVWFAKTLPRF